MLAAFADAFMSAKGLCSAVPPLANGLLSARTRATGIACGPGIGGVGSIDLAVPKLRRGVYSPEFLLEPRRRFRAWRRR